MTESSQAVKLHHRRVLGEELTLEEQQILDAWYAERDAAEAVSFSVEMESKELTKELKQQINEMLRQLSSTVNRIQQLTAENEQLKKENEQLKRLLTQRLSKQRA